MKLIKIAAACAALSIAVCAVVASTAHADVPSGRTTSPPLAKEAAVLTDRGVSPARASEALGLQTQVAETHLASSIEAALAGAYAGVWFEPAAARFHIGVTSNSSTLVARRVVAQAGLSANVVETPVRSTWFALIAAQNHWNKRLVRLLASSQASTGIDTRHNAVSIALSSSVPLAERAALEHEAATASVNVSIHIVPRSQLTSEPRAKKACETSFRTGKAFCEEALTAGAGISVEGQVQPTCTAGPMLIEGNETYMLTAGHCFGDETPTAGAAVTAKVTSAYPAGETQKEIGKEGTRFLTTEHDTAEVKVKKTLSPNGFTEPLPDPVPALVAEWSVKPATPHAVEGVKEATEAIIGQMVCHEGLTSGEHCGEVTKLSVTFNSTPAVEHLVETNACSDGGDSGGPYFFRTPTTKEVLMMGTEVGGPEGAGCSEAGPFVTKFEPLLDVGTAKGFGILSTFKGQELLTTKNEMRARNFECAQVTAGSGKYNEASCLKAGGTKEFEEKGITGAKFTAKSIAKTIITAGAKKVECTGATGEGVVTSSTEDVATIKYTGCTEEPSGFKCETSGAGAGVLVIPVSSKIVFYEGPSTNKAGLLVSPRNSTGENKTEFECVGTKVKVYGSVIGALTPTGEMSLSFTAKWQLNAGGENTIKEVGNELRVKFASAATEKATLAGEALLDFTLKVEVAP